MEFTSTEVTNTATSDPPSGFVLENESFSAQFWVTFNVKQAVIIHSLDDTSVTPEKLALAKSLIIDLQSFVTGAAVDLPKYDLRRSQEVREESDSVWLHVYLT